MVYKQKNFYRHLLYALIAMTFVTQAKLPNERLDHSQRLKEQVLERVKKYQGNGVTVPPTETKGVRVYAPAPIKLTTAQLMALESPQVVKGAQARMPAPTIPTSFSTSPVVVSHFTSADYRQTGQYGPSSEASKGSTQIMIGQKGRIMTFLPDGTPDNVLNISHDRFFSSVSQGGFTADPNIIRDPSSKRWFLLCGAGLSLLLLAMSDSDPVTANTIWSFYVIDSVNPNPGFDAVLPYLDYPTLGMDQKAVYCACNVYDEVNPSYLSSAAYVILKDSLISGGTPAIFAFRNLVNQQTFEGPYTLQGALNFDSNPTNGFFASLNLLDVLLNRSQQVLINKVTFSNNVPTLSAPLSVAVTPFVGPLFASALGTPEPLFDPGVRLCPAHIRNGILWVVHEIGVDNTGLSVPSTTITRNGARFYGFDTLRFIPVVLSQGTVFQPSAVNDFNQRCFLIPSIMTNILGQIVISATTCGKQERLNSSVTQIVNGIPGTPVLYTNSTSNYFATEDWEFDPNSRWGDHTRLSLDPNDSITFWPATMWCNATNTWATEIAQVVAQ